MMDMKIMESRSAPKIYRRTSDPFHTGMLDCSVNCLRKMMVRFVNHVAKKSNEEEKFFSLSRVRGQDGSSNICLGSG